MNGKLDLSSHRRSVRKKLLLNPPQLIIVSFLILITVGTCLLMLPLASASGHSIGLLDAWFTAVSAVCVNGLVVLDTGTAFSLFGQIVIMLLIQLGGLGFMTLGVMVAIILGKKIGLKERLLIQQTTQAQSAHGLVRMSLIIIGIAFCLELVGALILAWRWQSQLGFGEALYQGLFHAVSAFNNAGFALWSDSLSPFVGDPVINVTIIILFVIGGLGFIVIIDVWRKRSWQRLSLHSKIVLLASALFIGGGFVFILILESFNPATLAHLPWTERIWASLFQSATPRSAGFNTLDIGHMLAASQFLLIIFMFIGAASGGTGGGIKINTFVVLMLATWNTFRGGGQIHAFGRRVNEETVMRALAVILSSLAFVLLTAFLLNLTEGMLEEHFLELLFEATSAFSTTGLSTGLTKELSGAGKIIVIITMFIGRLGPLTLAYSLAQRKRRTLIGYPEDQVMIG